MSIRIVAAPLAIILSLVLATDAAAITWTGNRALTTSGGAYLSGAGLAVSSSTLVHAVYEENVLGAYAVVYRRSANSGTTWGTPIQMSTPGAARAFFGSLDAMGNAVDAVWIEGDALFSEPGSILVYRRSSDGGLTWQDPIQISHRLGSVGPPRVLHTTSGQVLITWTERTSHQVYVRVSTNGGVSFARARLLATTTSEGQPTLASGAGVIYAAYFSATLTVQLRRSTDGGSTWSTPVTIATDAFNSRLGLAANGSTVLLGWIAKGRSHEEFADEWTAVRRSTDKGVHWGSVVALSPQAGPPSSAPIISYRAGAFRAVFEKCSSSGCSRSNVIYRSSTTGSTWSTPSIASYRIRKYASAGDVDVATKVLILYTDTDPASDVYVRQGS